jgi:hypothetical protein
VRLLQQKSQKVKIEIHMAIEKMHERAILKGLARQCNKRKKPNEMGS